METLHETPNLHEFNVREEILPFIQDGSKKLEIRTASGRFLHVKEGDSIRFNGLGNCVKLVPQIDRFANFADLLTICDPNDVMPGMPPHTILTLLRTLYPPEREALGVLAFHLKTVD